MKNTKNNGDIIVKVLMAILAAVVIVLTVINSVPSFTNNKKSDNRITCAQNINTEANKANITYYELLDESSNS